MTRGVMENSYLKSLVTQFGLWNWEEDLVQNLYTIYDLQFIDCLAMGLRWKQMTNYKQKVVGHGIKYHMYLVSCR